MAWTTPTTQTSGALITASTWNTDLVDNLKYLKNAPTLDGLLTLGVGQLAFPASQNASSNANTLDDYEEGSWTPTIGGTGGETGQSYGSYRNGSYIKVGRFVCAAFDVQLSTKGTITGNVQIKGLPFLVSNTTNQNAGTCHIGYWDVMTSSVVYLTGHAAANSTAASLMIATAAATSLTNVAAGDLSNTTRFIGCVSYLASA